MKFFYLACSVYNIYTIHRQAVVYMAICISVSKTVKRLIFCSLQATTHVFGSCTDNFAGTSAATPIISSIVALTLEAKYVA